MISVKEEIINFSNNFRKNSNLKNLLNDLGNPQNKIKVINVVGTNGKGTVSNILSQGLQKKFKKVGLFTSPAFLYHNDRFKVNQEFISDETLLRLLEDNKSIFDKYELTFFEIFTFVCIKYFLEEKVDIAVIEAGIGGVSDSTSVFENQEFICVTSISLDHQEIIGKNIKDIILEKFKIVKENNFIYVSNDNVKYKKFIDANFSNVEFCEKILSGVYYNEGNLGLALHVLKKYSIYLTIDEIKFPIGRFTYLRKSPNILIDGCHNKDGILKAIKSLDKNNYTVLFASSKLSNFKYLKYFKRYNLNYFYCEFDHFKSWKLKQRQKNKKNFVVDWKNFIEKNLDKNLYICGSLYFIPDVYEFCKENIEKG